MFIKFLALLIKVLGLNLQHLQTAFITSQAFTMFHSIAPNTYVHTYNIKLPILRYRPINIIFILSLRLQKKHS